ncbi:unannotated protein [freshwater metagenome]|jgi:hypothetical protein|uniref:Unannotated protein n=1 Tax=freshwater metagenome TaxID=449393 RepID=A0A6J6UGJ8_9ZZZZ|nr:hypothetical protein [Actinomycetota bacterium]
MRNPPQKIPHEDAPPLEHRGRAVHVDWIWAVSVERVLEGPPDLLSWAN